MKKLNLMTFLTLLIFSSCSYHIGTIGGGTGTVTNSEFTSIDYAYGTAKTTNFLGIGGNQKNALVLEAKRNLYRNYQLSPTQVIGQTSVDFQRTFFFPFLTSRVTISSEIIDFSGSDMDTTLINYNRKQFIGPVENGSFAVGEVVNYRKNGKRFSATILAFHNDKYTIKFFDQNNRLKIKSITSGLYKSDAKHSTE